MSALRSSFRAAVILLAFRAFAQPDGTDALQSVFPASICLGDTVEIRCAFRTERNIVGQERQGRTELSADCPAFLAQDDTFTVLDARIERDGNDYVFLMNIVPWVTGTIAFPRLDLCSLVAHSGGGAGDGSFYLKLSPVEVQSVAEKNGVRSFLPPSPPLLMPGTVLLLACLSALFLLLFGLFVVAVANVPSIRTRLSAFLYLRSMRKVARRTVKKLLKLKKSSAAVKRDADFALALQRIFRDYLSGHFSENFAPLTSAEISGRLGAIFDSELPSDFEYACEFFARTDFVRFAHGSFRPGERERTVDALIRLVGAGA